MKTDLQLQQEVVEELKFEPSIREMEIAVAAKDGVVTLTGFVDNYVEKMSAERTAERVSGVKAVAAEIRVRLPGLYQRTDTDIAHAAVNALRWDIQVPDDRIKTTVENGWIHLDGEVEWQYQKWAAEDAVSNLMGVNGVTNVITVKPKKASSYEVGEKIKDSLRRHAERDADKITIDATDGQVTLRGTVSSFAERQDAERAAWQAPGVTNVNDLLFVTF